MPMPTYQKKKSPLTLLIIALIIFALAIIFELGFTKLANRDIDTFFAANSGIGTIKELLPEDFSLYEFEKKQNNGYYALAYNSYFVCDNLEGLWAQNIKVALSRDSTDDTETVIYYNAIVSGARGEYIAPLVKSEDGMYTARLDATELYSLRIFPTEKVRTTVTFSGVTINPTIIREGFSISRIILWVFILASIYTLYIVVLQKIKKAGRKPNAWIYSYIFLQTAVLIVAFQAPRMFTAVAGLDSLLLVAAFVMFSLFYFAVYFIMRRIHAIPLKLAACVMLAGTIFSVACAPLQAPDEAWHYLRAYTISCGDFSFNSSFQYPDEVSHLLELFPGNMYKEVQQKGTGSVLNSLTEFLNTSNKPYDGKQYASPMQVVVPYIPASIGIFVGRIFSSELMGFYLGRIANVFVLSACAYFALKWAKRYRGAIILTALFPLTLFMGASFSYDSFMFSCLLLMFGVLFKDYISRGDLVVLALSFGAIVAIKPIFAPLALLIFLIPKESFNLGDKLKKHQNIIAFIAVVLSGVFFYFGTICYANMFMSGISPVPNPAGVNVGAQISYVLSNPIRYALTAAVDGYMNCFYMDELGVFGWLDASAVLTNILAPISVVVVSLLYSEESTYRKKSDRWFFAAMSVLIYTIVVTGFYCTWSTLGSTSILGVQARYFIPILPCVFGVLSSLFGRSLHFVTTNPSTSKASRDTICIYICSALAVFASFELALLYFFT